MSGDGDDIQAIKCRLADIEESIRMLWDAIEATSGEAQEGHACPPQFILDYSVMGGETKRFCQYCRTWLRPEE